MDLIVNDYEFLKQVDTIVDTSENISDICLRYKKIIDSIKNNAIVDNAIDDKLSQKIYTSCEYISNVNDVIDSCRKNVEIFLAEIDEVDNLLQ